MNASVFFCLVLFLGFCLPNNSQFFINVFGAQIAIREFAFLALALINLLAKRRAQETLPSGKIRQLAGLILLLAALSELLKILAYGQGVTGAINSLRIGLPLFSCLLILATGLRVNIELVWKTLLVTVAFSSTLALLSIFVNLPIFGVIEQGSILEETRGRVINANYSFGIIGLALLYRGRGAWYGHGPLFIVAAIISLVALIATWNRTYLILLVPAVLYLTFTGFRLRNALTYITVPVLVLAFAVWLYASFDVINRMVDHRIINPLTGQTSAIESIYIDNRDIIFEGAWLRVQEGYWILGLPIHEPIFGRAARTDIGWQYLNVTDTSALNVLLRYGIIPLLLLGYLFLAMARTNRSFVFRFVLIIFAVASLNIDSLMRHNSILFLTLLFFTTMKVVAEINASSSQREPTLIRTAPVNLGAPKRIVRFRS